MAKTIYMGRDGELMSKEVWEKASKDIPYRTVRNYDNGVVNVTLLWAGKVNNPADSFRDYWPLYMIVVKNYTSQGTLALDPADSDKIFPDEAAAVKGYEKFLLKWTACETDAAGEFVEADNDLTPPPPPDPNKPSTESEELGETGAW